MSINNLSENKFKSILIRTSASDRRFGLFLKFIFNSILLDIFIWILLSLRSINFLKFQRNDISAQRSATTRRVLKRYIYAIVAPSSDRRFSLVKSISWKRVFDRARRQFARGDLNQERFVEEFVRFVLHRLMLLSLQRFAPYSLLFSLHFTLSNFRLALSRK